MNKYWTITNLGGDAGGPYSNDAAMRAIVAYYDDLVKDLVENWCVVPIYFKSVFVWELEAPSGARVVWARIANNEEERGDLCRDTVQVSTAMSTARQTAMIYAPKKGMYTKVGHLHGRIEFAPNYRRKIRLTHEEEVHEIVLPVSQDLDGSAVRNYFRHHIGQEIGVSDPHALFERVVVRHETEQLRAVVAVDVYDEARRCIVRERRYRVEFAGHFMEGIGE